MRAAGSVPPILVKRYAGSRLYDTDGLRYLSLDDLRAWSENGVRFRVVDSDTHEDVTRILLA
jgi:polyhydroxyalkanoate synthesis regulator protein